MIDRRHVLALFGSCLASPAFAQAPAMSKPSAYAFSFTGLDGGNLPDSGLESRYREFTSPYSGLAQVKVPLRRVYEDASFSVYARAESGLQPESLRPLALDVFP